MNPQEIEILFTEDNTSDAEPTLRALRTSAVVNSLIQKPVDLDQFCETVRTLGIYSLVVNQAPPRQFLNTCAGNSA
ncbi:MAG TPA: hypothetical protein VGT24_00010 [Candidatus Acidoferrales bacterium]|nr:hypothetical protein [Candidatus Acidoferrales bacterium]